jgi:hypothetical protein
VLLAAREGRLADGELIDPQLRPGEVSHAEIEAAWEQWALPRLRDLVESSSNTRDG